MESVEDAALDLESSMTLDSPALVPIRPLSATIMEECLQEAVNEVPSDFYGESAYPAHDAEPADTGIAPVFTFDSEGTIIFGRPATWFASLQDGHPCKALYAHKDKVSEWGAFVGRLQTCPKGVPAYVDRPYGYGTASLVSPTGMLTARHMRRDDQGVEQGSFRAMLSSQIAGMTYEKAGVLRYNLAEADLPKTPFDKGFMVDDQTGRTFMDLLTSEKITVADELFMKIVLDIQDWGKKMKQGIRAEPHEGCMFAVPVSIEDELPHQPNPTVVVISFPGWVSMLQTIQFGTEAQRKKLWQDLQRLRAAEIRHDVVAACGADWAKDLKAHKATIFAIWKQHWTGVSRALMSTFQGVGEGQKVVSPGRLLAVGETTAQYTATTLPGSSGALVMPLDLLFPGFVSVHAGAAPKTRQKDVIDPPRPGHNIGTSVMNPRFIADYLHGGLPGVPPLHDSYWSTPERVAQKGGLLRYLSTEMVLVTACVAMRKVRAAGQWANHCDDWVRAAWQLYLLRPLRLPDEAAALTITPNLKRMLQAPSMRTQIATNLQALHTAGNPTLLAILGRYPPQNPIQNMGQGLLESMLGGLDKTRPGALACLQLVVSDGLDLEPWQLPAGCVVRSWGRLVEFSTSLEVAGFKAAEYR